MEKRLFKLPWWATVFYSISAIVLIPWTYALVKNLPNRQLAEHWDIAWAGLDVFMLLLIALTVFFAIRRTVWVALSATALSTVLLIDAWFDVLTSKPGGEQITSLVLAMLVGVPMAFFTYMMAHRSISQLHNKLGKKR